MVVLSFLQANTWTTTLSLVHDCFLPDPFHFVISQYCCDRHFIIIIIIIIVVVVVVVFECS